MALRSAQLGRVRRRSVQCPPLPCAPPLPPTHRRQAVVEGEEGLRVLIVHLQRRGGGAGLHAAPPVLHRPCH